jgi:hypothetical protein
MKKTLIFIVVIFLHKLAIAAPKVLISGNFSMVEPLTEQQYTLTEYEMPADITNLSVVWHFTGQTGTYEYDDRVTSPYMIRWKVRKVQWTNSINGSGLHTVYAVLSYKIEGSGTTYTLTSPTVQIQVKHIGAINTINIAGTNYNNNQYREHSCGTSSINISVPAPATDPVAAISYTWTFPSGWSPASITTTTASTSVTPNAGGQGIIKLEAKRVDGTTKQTILVNITRPLPTRPTINSGDILLCSPQNVTATSSNATSYEWVGTGGITPSGTTNSAYVTGTSDGTLRVRSYSSVCAAYSAYSDYINVKKSAPILSTIQVSANGGGSPDFMCNGSGVDLNVWTGEPGTNWGPWTVSDPAKTYFNYSGPTAYFNSYVNNCYGIDIAVSNCFGTVHKGVTICVDNCAVKAEPTYTVFPNPANDILNIAFENVEDFSALPSTITLLSEESGREVKSLNLTKDYSSTSFKTSKTLAMMVNDLPRGTYYLHLGTPKGEDSKLRIILK